MMKLRLVLALLVGFAAGAAQAQQLYRWTDEKGRVHVTDTPPPASAKGVQTKKPVAEPTSEPQSFELMRAQKDFPVVLYTSPPCKGACDQARTALNKRGIPFKEVIVYDEGSQEQLQKLAGSSDIVPVLVVGRSVQKGFEQAAFDALLDAAGYPKSGTLPPRAQAAPKPPDDYVAPTERGTVKAEPVKPEAEEPRPAGPYSPGSTPPRRTPPQK